MTDKNQASAKETDQRQHEQPRPAKEMHARLYQNNFE
jgi:hypothetical protein